ncbi:MAG TPA: hypothetical protein VFE13_09015 [Caulobacteraceae bacterium]|nr:hypothetical protein [Caulobacteraceae bacterium]
MSKTARGHAPRPHHQPCDEIIAKFPPTSRPPLEPSNDGLPFGDRGAFPAAFAPDAPVAECASMADARVPLAASAFAMPITDPA